MCGIAMMIGPGINQPDVQAFRDLLYVTSLRGTDATGLIQGKVSDKRQINSTYMVIKTEDASPVFIDKVMSGRNSRKVLDDIFDNFYIGHCRASTVGKNSEENAHPFEFRNVVGVHNGTLKDAKYLNNGTKTDSECLYEDINERGILPVLADLHPDSAYTLAMYDKAQDKIVIARNKARPLWCMYNEKRAVFYLASEYSFLEFIANRYGLDTSDTMYIEENHVFTFSPHDVKANTVPDWTKEAVVKSEKTNPLSYSPPVVYRGYQTEMWDSDWQGWRPQVTENEEGTNTSGNEERSADNGNKRNDPYGAIHNRETGVCAMSRMFPTQNCRKCGIALNHYGRYLAKKEVLNGKDKYVCAGCCDEETMSHAVSPETNKEEVAS